LIIENLLEKVQLYSADAEVQVIMNAYLFSAQAHNGQTRKSGEAYLTHPLAVAEILAELQMDVDTIATGLLHDTMEDCMTTKIAIADTFGDEVANLVDGVTKIGKLRFKSQEEAQAANFRKMILAMSNDIRVILVKLADRLHNMRTMEHMKPEKQVAISRETMDIYAPIANRLGLSKLKTELEDICFRYLEPNIYATLSRKLQEKAPDHHEYITLFKVKLKQSLNESGIKCEVYGRVKNLVSIYRKMQSQNLNFDQIHDLLAFRVLTTSLGDCYTSLGMVHGLYPHHPNRLKDYIAQPKSNGYQSLHTVILPEGRQVEVQIRTEQMHQIAEVGIAAHWKYKEGHLALSREDIQQIGRLRAIFEAAREVIDPNEFLETVKVDLFSMEIFVFTPAGDVKIFPSSATALDFAYAVHTEVGNNCVGAKIDGRIVPLRYELQNGDRVEILTSSNQSPSRDWLDIAKTGRALSKIRRVIRENERIRGIELGEELLTQELQKHNIKLNKVLKSGKLKEVAQNFGHKSIEPLFHGIASGTYSLSKVLQLISPVAQESIRSPITSFFNRIRSRSTSPVLINGEGDILTSFARCCSPLPGEPVIGFITRGHGISVHRVDCKQLLHLDTNRRVPVQWQDTDRGAHSSEIEILCTNQMGLLADLGAVCKTQNINVNRMEAHTIEEENKAIIIIEVGISHVDQLNSLMRSLQHIEGVIYAKRRRAEDT
jgi:GTP diphosphokinase / guanosine-3',5'-bis(diphosphate) 3'-diphosphatase